LPRLTESQTVDGKPSLELVKMWFFFTVDKNGYMSFDPSTALNFVKRNTLAIRGREFSQCWQFACCRIDSQCLFDRLNWI